MPAPSKPRAEATVEANGTANSAPTSGPPLWAVAPKDRFAPQLRALVVPIDSLVPDPNNARVHGERNMWAIKDSLALYGQKKPIVVRAENMTVMAGNGTLAALRDLGWTLVAASVEPMTDEEAAGYGLADNRTAELAAWNFEVVARLARVQEEINGTVVGWSADDLKKVYASEFKPQSDPDEIPEPPKIALTKLGDTWILGEHRLLCGDSADEKSVAKLMTDSKGYLMATDPPYGVEFGKANHNPTAKQWGAIKGDDREGSELRSWLTGVLKTWIPYILDDSSFYVWSASMAEGHRFYEAIIDAGIHIQSQVVWAKNVFAMGQADYQWKHEPAWYGFFKGKKHRWYGGRDKTSVWEVKRLATGSYLHPMQKPVELYERPMEHHTVAGNIVVEPFCGSGTQYIAAHKLGRVCYGMELDPVYVDVTLQRFLDFTGIDPVRESDGKKFSDLKKRAK